MGEVCLRHYSVKLVDWGDFVCKLLFLLLPLLTFFSLDQGHPDVSIGTPFLWNDPVSQIGGGSEAVIKPKGEAG